MGAKLLTLWDHFFFIIQKHDILKKPFLLKAESELTLSLKLKTLRTNYENCM